MRMGLILFATWGVAYQVAGVSQERLSLADSGKVVTTTSRFQFEVASIKSPPPGPGRRGFGGGKRISSMPLMFRTINSDVGELIVFAYHLPAWRVKGLPVDSGRYDINAKTPFPATEAEERIMLQALLADRFGLVCHYEHRRAKGYALIAVRTQKLEPAPPEAEPGIRFTFNASDRSAIPYQAKATTMDELADWLSSNLSVPVLNESGIEGRFDFVLRVSTGADPNSASNSNSMSVDTSAIDYIDAIRKLGLDMKPRDALVDILVIDRFEKPSPN